MLGGTCASAHLHILIIFQLFTKQYNTTFHPPTIRLSSFISRLHGNTTPSRGNRGWRTVGRLQLYGGTQARRPLQRPRGPHVRSTHGSVGGGGGVHARRCAGQRPKVLGGGANYRRRPPALVGCTVCWRDRAHCAEEAQGGNSPPPPLRARLPLFKMGTPQRSVGMRAAALNPPTSKCRRTASLAGGRGREGSCCGVFPPPPA